jgi:hypothetical protein
MKYTLTLLALIVLLSCVTKKNQLENEVETIDEERVVFTELKILVKVPYCGGAQPTDDMLNRTKPVTAAFMLRGDNGYERKVEPNELGIINLALEAGKYHLKELSKDVPFLTFYSSQKALKNTINYPNIKIGSEACYNEWWQKNVIDFKITDSTTLINETAFIFSNCYTTNPCDTYTGPIRP